MVNYNGLDEYVATSIYFHPPKRGKLSPKDLEQFSLNFGAKISAFYGGEVYYVGKSDGGMYIFTNKESWIKYSQRLKRKNENI